MTPPSKWRGVFFLLADELDKAVHILKQIASHRVYTRLCNGVSHELAIGYSPLFPAGPSIQQDPTREFCKIRWSRWGVWWGAWWGDLWGRRNDRASEQRAGPYIYAWE